MNVGSLFSGVGGFDLGFERAGMRVVWQSEIEPFARAVLRKHWPDVPNLGDVRDISAAPAVDVLCGGPPCTATSVAAAIHGRRTGETLWPEMRRIAAELCPGVVVVEQLAGNKAWETKVSRDLESLGYYVWRRVIAASEFGAPHPRRRVFFIADRDSARLAFARLRLTSEAESGAWLATYGNHWSPDYARAVRVVDGVPARVGRRSVIERYGSAVLPQIAEAIGRAILNCYSENI